LVKRPARKSRSLGFANRYPITDAAKFFKGDTAIGAFSLIDNLFADVVVNPSGEAMLFTRKPFELASRGMGLFF
jgi:hypothetical protein